MKIGAIAFGSLSAAFGLFLLVGVALPGNWSAEIVGDIPAPPSAVFPHFNRMALWPQWSPMPDSGIELFGPPEGAGAGLRWDDPQYGRGEVRIVGGVEQKAVDYEVVIEGGRLAVHGSIRLEATPSGTRVLWREEGDFGWNPLMGYAARKMPDTQKEAMTASLADLRLRF